MGPDSKHHPVAFASKTCSAAEARYGSTDGELLALIYGLTKFHHYIAGSSFQVVTDHQALLHLESAKATNSRLARWALKLADYDFKVIYRQGRVHGNADGLTRAAATPSLEPHVCLDVSAAGVDPGTDDDAPWEEVFSDDEADFWCLPADAAVPTFSLPQTVGPRQALLESAPCAACAGRIQ